MNDELPEERSGFSRSDAAPNPAALDAALVAAGANSQDAREFLGEQTRLTALQAKILHEEHALELSHLRWRRFNDQMKGALQIILAVLGISLVAAIAATVWSASQADGIIVDSFSVPPSLAQAGLNGDVVAGDVTNRLAQMRRYVNGISIGTTRDIRSDSRDDVRVEIPETGVSLAALWRDLRDWLGSERRVIGSVREGGDGQLELVVSLAGADPVIVTGDSAHLPALERSAAEGLFSEIAPSNYALFLAGNRRYAEALSAARRATDIGQAGRYGLIGNALPPATGDFRKAAAYARLAMALAPRIQVFRTNLVSDDDALGWAEEELRTARSIVPLSQADQSPIRETRRGFEALRRGAERRVALLTGDYINTAIVSCFGICASGQEFALKGMLAGLLHDPREGMRLLAVARLAGDAEPDVDALAAWSVAVAKSDWQGARSAAVEFRRAIAADSAGLSPRYVQVGEATEAAPRLALANAYLDAFAEARRAIGATPRDCYDCVRTRGDIEALARNWGGAAHWFADAVRQAPDIPFAYADWGEMLLHKGDYEAAIAKFAVAHAKGPHFADPLEMWGEALMQQNRSDLALAKFAEANNYAPNWGRLRLEWGKALIYAGRRAEAQQQFATASHLDMSTADTADLVRWRAKRG